MVLSVDLTLLTVTLLDLMESTRTFWLTCKIKKMNPLVKKKTKNLWKKSYNEGF